MPATNSEKYFLLSRSFCILTVIAALKSHLFRFWFYSLLVWISLVSVQKTWMYMYVCVMSTSHYVTIQHKLCVVLYWSCIILEHCYYYLLSYWYYTENQFDNPNLVYNFCCQYSAVVVTKKCEWIHTGTLNLNCTVMYLNFSLMWILMAKMVLIH